MLAPRLCGGARILAVTRVGIAVRMSHELGLQTPKKHEEILVVLPDRRAAVVRPDRAGRERFGLGGEIDLGVDIRGLDRDVPKPRADGIDVDSCAQQMSCGRVAPMSLATLMQFLRSL